MSEQLKYEILQTQDNKQFIEVFEKAFNRRPELDTMTALVVKDGPEIVGFLGMYSITVCDSMWVREDKRNKGLCVKLLEGIRDLPWRVGRGVHLVERRNREGAMAKKFGARPLPWKLWTWNKE